MNIKIFFLGLFIGTSVYSQNSDSVMIRGIFNYALTHGKSMDNLQFLCKKIGPRLSGSPSAAEAVKWAQTTMKEMGADTVFLQECMVPHWVRGEKEIGEIRFSDKTFDKLNVCALGGSVATPQNGITAEVIEVQGFDELAALGKAKIAGKIVFYNRAMDPRQIRVGAAYGGAVNQRSQGAIVAARYGALAVIVRSMTTGIDDYPHTGAMRYVDTVAKIPACAISTKGAEHLSAVLKKQSGIRLFLKMNCHMLPDEVSYNVVGEIKGSEHPEEIIAIGGHLDSWDLGEGAHDDGAGVVQSMEILYLFKKLGIKPKRTIRIVAFMNEENGVRGANKYAELAGVNKEKHLAAMESDSGGFSPMGFQLQGDAKKVAQIKKWSVLFVPYLIFEFAEGHGGTDVEPLAKQGATLIGLSPNSQRYFDYHHCVLDKLENVDERELAMGAASMASMVYLLDYYGI